MSAYTYVRVQGAQCICTFQTPSPLPEPLPSNVFLLPFDPINVANYWWDANNEQLVAYTPQELELLTSPPSRFHTWNAATKAWEDNRTLAQAQADQKVLLEEQKNSGAVTVFSDPEYFRLTTREMAELALVGVKALNLKRLVGAPEMTLEWPNQNRVPVTLGDTDAVLGLVAAAADRVASITTYLSDQYTDVGAQPDPDGASQVPWDPPPPEPVP